MVADLTKPCPNCEQTVLEDTVQCLGCGYRFDLGRVEPIRREAMPSADDSNVQEISCPECGVDVREHLVRCWNCGAFMRPEIREEYQRMKERQPTVEYVPLPDWEGTDDAAEEETDSATYSLAAGDEEHADDVAGGETFEDDFDADVEFELDTGDVDGEEDDDLFDLGDDVETSDSAEPVASTPPPTETPRVRRPSEEPPVRRPAEEPAVRRGGHASQDAAASAPAEAATPAAEESPEETAEDDLLAIAMEEEKEVDRRRRRTDKLLEKRAAARKKKAAARRLARQRNQSAKASGKRAKRGPVAGKYVYWMNDVPFHAVDPAKTKVKPGSLARATRAVDLGFAKDGLLVVSYTKEKGSLFGGRSIDPADSRKAVVEHLKKQGPLDELPAEAHWTLDAETAGSLPFEQPNEYAHETVFGGVPPFGEGRIALTMPSEADDPTRRFLVFALSRFRRFVNQATIFGTKKDFGDERGIPLEDVTEEFTCHYTDQKFTALVDPSYHEHDPAIELRILGRRCQNCELVVSEDGRKKERIGGKAGKSIGTAKCPKCNEPFGNRTLYEVVKKRPAAKRPVKAL